MGAHVSRNDFEWTYTEEPHASRRKMMLEKYPQIKKLYGQDPKLKWTILGIMLVQLVMVYLIKDYSWPFVLLVTYIFGGTISHSLILGMHEVSHGLAFGHSRPMYNRLLGIISNLPTGIPSYTLFKKYHMEHHKNTGNEAIDADIPTLLEAKLFCNTFGKFMWIILQPLIYMIRPFCINPKAFTLWDFLNFVVQFTFDASVWYFCGFKGLAYLCFGTLTSMGLHPVAGHFIAEHYMFKKGYETYSYYGPLNWISFNGGYHNEHHDFPAIPGSRLPEVKRIAPEFYDNLPHHTSWVRVMYDFVFDPDIGPYARIKRKANGLQS